jgi:hypothetical protein
MIMANMHYVPKIYMKPFSVEKMKAGTKQYYIQALKKDLTGKIEERNTRRICAEEDLYALPGGTEQERLAIERMYRDLFEKGYETLYKLMTDHTRDQITADERYDIVAFVVSLFYRNNKWVTFFNSMMDDILRRAFELSNANGKDSFYFEEKEISIVGKTLEQLQVESREQDRPMIAITTMERIFALTRFRVNNDFISITKKRGPYEFITSDNPVSMKAKKPTGHLTPFDPDNSLWLPLDKDHLLQVEPWANQLEWSMIGRINEIGAFPGIMASMSNFFQWQQCETYLLGTLDGLITFQQNPEGILKGKTGIKA